LELDLGVEMGAKLVAMTMDVVLARLTRHVHVNKRLATRGVV
jgi:hypothetical protein